MPTTVECYRKQAWRWWGCGLLDRSRPRGEKLPRGKQLIMGDVPSDAPERRFYVGILTKL